MVLLHKKSILDCYDYLDYIKHSEEVTQIFNKLQQMYNYYCFILVLDERWKYGVFLNTIDHATYYGMLHDIREWFLDENNFGIDFAIDDGNLLMMSYHEKIGGLSFIKRIVAIRALESRESLKQRPIDHEFM